MPHIILKKVWDYCTYNKKFLLFIIVLLFISSLIQNYIRSNGNYYDLILLQGIVFISVSGYGMAITRSRINHGKRLPKIIVKDIAILGIKSNIVMAIYLAVQAAILTPICSSLNFPTFNLEELIINWPKTMQMLFNHEPINTILFIIAGAVVFYITTFFMEIAQARLADTNKILSSFDFLAIKRNIDVIGWRNYAKDYTLIVLTIVILSYLVSYDLPFKFIDSIIDMFLSFLIFATQYLGIGAIYAQIKDLECDRKIKIDLK